MNIKKARSATLLLFTLFAATSLLAACPTDDVAGTGLADCGTPSTPPCP